MSIPLNLQAEIIVENGRPAIKLFPEWDPELSAVLRNHEDVNALCSGLKSRAREAFGPDNSARDE